MIRHRRVVHRSAAIGDHHEHVIAIDQFIRRLHRSGNGVLIVLGNIFDLAAVYATGGVDLIKHHPPGVVIVHAPHRGHTGQISVCADDNFRVGNASHAFSAHRRREGHAKRGDPQGYLGQFLKHVFLLP